MAGIARLALAHHSQQRTPQSWPAQKTFRYIDITIAIIRVLPRRCVFPSQEVARLQMPPCCEPF